MPASTLPGPPAPAPLDPGPLLAARARLAGVAHRTPVLRSSALDAALGAELFFKCENLQRVGAFKFRGAYNAISQRVAQAGGGGVVTHSSGNHAQGVALAARLLGVEATVVMPHDAPPEKRAAVEGYGARVVPCDAVDREVVCQGFVDQGLTLIHPYDDLDVIAGQGTASYELFEEVGPLDLLIAPVGGGGLISGATLAAAALSPACALVGVEPEGADDAGRSWREGRVVELEAVPRTEADGLRTRSIGAHNLRHMRAGVHQMLTVPDAALVEAMRLVFTRMKLVIEPSAAAPLAALLSGALPLRGERVGLLISGGNVGPERFAALAGQADASGS